MMFDNCSRVRSCYRFGSTLGSSSFLINKPSVVLINARNFVTGFPFARECSRMSTLSTQLMRCFQLQQRRFFQRGTLTEGKMGRRDLPEIEKARVAAEKCNKAPRKSCNPVREKPFRPTQKCLPPSPPCCRRRPKNPKCAAIPQSPCPPPCPTPCPKPPEQPPPPKICYRKCPPPPKLPKLPKCPEIPCPPPHPPLPKLPRPPKCPPPCPPPPAPPLPKCPSAPRCPECPPQRECPPPPPCEPCPCPPPCPPPCCPPPPPCPPCPPCPLCPRPLPCPPTPPPRLCPPCPPCPPCPKPPPCPPPPPCCPCPCPKPPPPCPCPKPCPPCKPVEPSCPDQVPSCPRSSTKIKKRKMSTYQAPPRFTAWKVLSRKFNSSSILMGNCGKSGGKCRKTSCQEDVCVEKKGCVKTCERKQECKAKRSVCEEPPKKEKEQKKKPKKDCSKCIPRGKCDQPALAVPQKMVYDDGKCPVPKFVKPKPCPSVPEPKHEQPEPKLVCKGKKEVCIPPPLPKAPTKPIILCPCPPPPKLYPGPCPCYDLKVLPPAKPKFPPCPVQEKYVCCKKTHYCPPEPPCEREEPCNVKRKRKEKTKKKK